MPPVTPMQLRMLDSAVQYAVQNDVAFSTWPLFRDYLAEQGCLKAEELDAQRNFVFDCYLKHNSEKKTFHHPATPPASPENEPRGEILNPTVGQLPDPAETVPFSPTLDTFETKRSENLSIFIQHENTWDGTGWDFCTQDDSFISTRIVQRNSLEVKEQRTELSWKFHGQKKTYRTWFIVVEDGNMEDDIMLGKNWDNVESQTRMVPSSHNSGQEVEQPLGMNTLLANEVHHQVQQAILETFQVSPLTDAESLSAVEARVARLNVHSTLFLDTFQASNFPLRLSHSQGVTPFRRNVEDARSDSSSSQGQHQERRLAPSLVDDLHPRSRPRNPSFYPAVRPPEEPPPP